MGTHLGRHPALPAQLRACRAGRSSPSRNAVCRDRQLRVLLTGRRCLVAAPAQQHAPGTGVLAHHPGDLRRSGRGHLRAGLLHHGRHLPPACTGPLGHCRGVRVAGDAPGVPLQPGSDDQGRAEPRHRAESSLRRGHQLLRAGGGGSGSRRRRGHRDCRRGRRAHSGPGGRHDPDPAHGPPPRASTGCGETCATSPRAGRRSAPRRPACPGCHWDRKDGGRFGRGTWT